MKIRLLKSLNILVSTTQVILAQCMHEYLSYDRKFSYSDVFETASVSTFNTKTGSTHLQTLALLTLHHIQFSFI